MFHVEGNSIDFALNNGTIILNEHIWGTLRFISQGGNLALTDVTTFNCREWGANIKLSYGSATFTNVVMNSDKGGCVDIGDGASATSPSGASAVMTNCTFNQTNEGSTDNYKTVSAAIITSYSGHVTLNSGTYSAYYALFPHSSGGTITVKDGCTITGRQNAVHTVKHGNTTTQEDHIINIEGGTINGSFDVATDGHTTFSITGGTFDHDPSAYVADGYVATQSGNVWTVTKLNTPVAIGSVGYETLDAAVTAATDGQTVTILQADEYVIPAIEKNLTIEASVNGVVVEHTTDAAITTIALGKTATFKNITFNLGSAVKMAQKHGFGTLNGDNGALVMDGCTVNGALNLFGESTFSNCSFSASGIYNIWAVNSDASFTDCSFTNTNRAVNVYDQKSTGTPMNVSFTNCTFAGIEERKAAINVHHNPNHVNTPANYTVSINNCTTTGTWASVPETTEIETTICNNTLWMVSDIENYTLGDISISVDGVAQDLTWGVAKIGNVCYATLQEAIDACPANTQTTITVLCNVANGAGFQIPDGTTGKNIIIDFASHNYTFANTPVGSNKTINQCMHFGVGNTLTLKNGTLNVKEGFTIETSPFKIMMQNYSNLTVENMTVNTSNIPTQTYVGSSYGVWEGRTRPLFNFIKGTSTVTGSTFIFSNTDQFGITCDSPATLTLGEGNVVNGNVTAYDGAIAITGGTYNGTVGVTDVEVNAINGSITITGGTFNVNPSAYVAPGYGVTRDGGNYVVAAVNTTWDGSSKAALTDLGNDTYGIYSAAQLAQFSYEVTNNINNYAGKTVKLMNDIDLNNKAWTPIGLGGTTADHDYGSETGCFLGTFDGQNKTISNLTATHINDDRSFAALFGNITLTTAKNVVIKNVNVTNVNINSKHQAAGILARTHCNAGSITIDHCSVTGGTITSTPFYNGSEMESGNQAAGIIGLAQGNNAAGINITNNTVFGITVTATRDLGGLIGCLKLGGTVTGNSVYNSTVKQEYPDNYESGKVMSTVKAIIGRTYESGGTVTNNTDTNVTVTLQN